MSIKTPLILLMIPIELLLLMANFVIALISPSLGKRFLEWNIKTLPNREWYS